MKVWLLWRQENAFGNPKLVDVFLDPEPAEEVRQSIEDHDSQVFDVWVEERQVLG